MESFEVGSRSLHKTTVKRFFLHRIFPYSHDKLRANKEHNVSVYFLYIPVTFPYIIV